MNLLIYDEIHLYDKVKGNSWLLAGIVNNGNEK